MNTEKQHHFMHFHDHRNHKHQSDFHPNAAQICTKLIYISIHYCNDDISSWPNQDTYTYSQAPEQERATRLHN